MQSANKVVQTIFFFSKAELPQVGIFFHTQFPSLGIFICKKFGFRKNKKCIFEKPTDIKSFPLIQGKNKINFSTKNNHFLKFNEFQKR